MVTKFNNPNWEAHIDYRPSREYTEPLTLKIEQVWDGTKAGHERLIRQCTAEVEGWRDRLGGSYTCYWALGPQREKIGSDADRVTFVD